MRESAYKGEVSMYKLNDIHNSDGKGNFEKMVISEADRVKPIIKEQFLREYILGTGDTYEIFNIYCKTFGGTIVDFCNKWFIRGKHGICVRCVFTAYC